MSRIPPLDPNTAEGKAKELLSAVEAKMGSAPNILKTMAQAPAVLQSYLSFSGALREGILDSKLQEKIALFAAQANQCDYCLAAHTTIAKGAGLEDQAMLDARAGKADDAKDQAVLDLAKKIIEKRGFVDDADLETARSSGLSDPEILEVTAHVALNTFTNYFNHLVDTDIDFPASPPLNAGE